MKKIFYLLLAILIVSGIILLFPDLSQAQPPPPTKPAQNPIDGGLGLLAAAGGAYAIKKLRDKNK